MPVKWVRLSDIALKGVDFYICAGCGDSVPFEECWSVIPMSISGKQMMQGYIHCTPCSKKEPMRSWKLAHERETPHRAGYET